MFTACGIKHRRYCLQAASSALHTTSCKQSSAPEDGRNYRPKHVELIEIINKTIIVVYSWLFILWYDFQKKKVFEHKMSVLSLQLLYEAFLILRTG